MAVTGHFVTSGYVDNQDNGYYSRALDFIWTRASYDVGANTSTIRYILKAINGRGGYVVATAITLTVDGEIVYTSPAGLKVYKDQELYRGEIVVKHDSNGERSFTASISGGLYYRGNVSGDGRWVLDPITRHATIVSAPSFNDLANPILNYTNPSGAVVSSLQACISLDGTKDDIPYRDIPKSGSSYTFNLTEAERNTLRNATVGSNSRTVKFHIKTVNGGVTYYHSVAKKFTIVDNSPLIENITIRDTYGFTQNLTGDANKLIRYKSTATVNFTYEALKGATIVEHKVIGGNTTIPGIPAHFGGNEIDTFILEVKDSRGNVTTKTVKKDLIPYVKLTCNMSNNKPDINGNMTVNVYGNYFSGSFGAVNNSLTVEYRYKTAEGNWSSWSTLSHTLGDETYNAETELSGLDPYTLYVFQARATDKLGTIYSTEREVKSTPIFDWGETDFNFNVPVTIQGDLTVSGVIHGAQGSEVPVDPATDFIIEQGTVTTGSGNSTANWVYRKWNSGVAECWCRKHVSTAVNTVWGNLYVSGALSYTNITWGVDFIDIPVANITIAPNASGAFLIAGGSTSLTKDNTGGYEIARGSALASAGNFYINYYGIGRWK